MPFLIDQALNKSKDGTPGIDKVISEETKSSKSIINGLNKSIEFINSMTFSIVLNNYMSKTTEEINAKEIVDADYANCIISKIGSL